MKTALLGLLTETSLHAGAGQSAGVIDLPIQREAHTDWPVVFGSAVKGALRAAAETASHTWVNTVFGPDTNNAADNAGALLVGDARLLLLPVRSLTSHFRWVTCPALLRRFRSDCDRLGIATNFEIPTVEGEASALVANDKTGPLFLEEFRFEMQPADLASVIAAIVGLLSVTEAATLLQAQLTVIPDNLFAHLSRYATPVNAHIAIDNKTKTVNSGALWYEETLPPDTLLYVALAAQHSRVKDETKSAERVLAHITDDLFAKPYLQLGGNETVGMGWCKIAFCMAQSQQEVVE
ncbi:MAG: type III-B CRISPR module RAMP protein Cmr4 [Candidatus Competibacteraceae bacterium]|nr:type III-B CRISPR module RAMP protein Cmr4 [Candidatus Competibacteraceae bacterium]MCB1803810.1 type III-B CRISPR module RAMP protein Cmr4 [Candidatus Competibacteraceae bacterium]MCB1813247.1 type III-B CRISPR module RAMP protein Cmr4 [Candidatus Competibacteraceae bacterium]